MIEQEKLKNELDAVIAARIKLEEKINKLQEKRMHQIQQEKYLLMKIERMILNREIVWNSNVVV
jgi:nitrogen regulatory protein PII-like uncharacterized protein